MSLQEGDSDSSSGPGERRQFSRTPSVRSNSEDKRQRRKRRERYDERVSGLIADFATRHRLDQHSEDALYELPTQAHAEEMLLVLDPTDRAINPSGLDASALVERSVSNWVSCCGPPDADSPDDPRKALIKYQDLSQDSVSHRVMGMTVPQCSRLLCVTDVSSARRPPAIIARNVHRFMNPSPPRRGRDRHRSRSDSTRPRRSSTPPRRRRRRSADSRPRRRRRSTESSPRSRTRRRRRRRDRSYS
eukprot:TRINITY_DN40486_c0_g1_i1.p1 TRINITY_DN40486_c0_g1~~TRINITY_DN40486_c0_g1_i1.p1  ORF type:complete len:246 (+),score=54.43 TRINITY_DN40486_c0_g1_i1:99-836(+)